MVKMKIKHLSADFHFLGHFYKAKKLAQKNSKFRKCIQTYSVHIRLQYIISQYNTY